MDPLRVICHIFLSHWPESNWRPTPYHGVALPSELQRHLYCFNTSTIQIITQGEHEINYIFILIIAISAEGSSTVYA